MCNVLFISHLYITHGGANPTKQMLTHSSTLYVEPFLLCPCYCPEPCYSAVLSCWPLMMYPMVVESSDQIAPYTPLAVNPLTTLEAN
jgi:hypothetical protein